MDKEDLEKFSNWYETGLKCNPAEPAAMALTTIGDDNKPSTRMVLLKAFDENGFVFYTNLGSKKGQQLNKNNKVSICFDWRADNGRIVKIQGIATAVSDAEADKYFNSRYLFSRLGAWASKQSSKTPHRYFLLLRVWFYLLKYIVNLCQVKRPEFWSGFRTKPVSIEFIGT